MLTFTGCFDVEFLARLLDHLRCDPSGLSDLVLDLADLIRCFVALLLQFLGDGFEHVATEKLAKQLLAIARLVEEESLNFTLRENHHPLELLSVEPDQIADMPRNILHT